jgi:hypothetical protein
MMTQPAPIVSGTLFADWQRLVQRLALLTIARRAPMIIWPYQLSRQVKPAFDCSI